MNLQVDSDAPSWFKAIYIYFTGAGAQTWSLENICMNPTSDSSQEKIQVYEGNVTYTKKVNITDCNVLPATTSVPRPTTTPNQTNPFKD